MIDLADDTLKGMVEARTRANALYSLYKDAHAQEEAYQSIISEQLRATYGLDEQVELDLIKEVRTLIDKRSNNK